MEAKHPDVLEERVRALEEIVFGSADKDSVYPKDLDADTQCINSLYNTHAKVMAACCTNENIIEAFKNLKNIQKYVDDACTNEMTLLDSAKQDLILSEEDFILKQVENLESIQKLKELIGSEHIKATPAMVSRLQELSQIHINQQDQVALMTGETRKVLAAYNSIVTMVSKQFIQWDEMLTHLEIAAQPKKILD